MRPLSVGQEHLLLPVREQVLPNYRWSGRTIAGDRPPRYGEKRATYRRARACPSPSNDRGGNPLGCACGIRGPPRYGEKRADDRCLFGRHSRTTDRGGERSRGTGPRATVKNGPLTVGRGPVPRHAAIAGETRSDARVASEGPRDTGKKRADDRCLFGRHSRTTDRGGRTIAGDRPPRYGEKTGHLP